MNPATALARTLIDELVRGGVTDAVLSPGSRSAPLALALAGCAAVRLHVRIDERSAGYLAVGLALRSGRPVPVVCTSGTAAANLHPAVLEAAHARLPLLVVTADRPPELRGTGANQTVEQVGLYGGAVRLSVDLGVPERRAGQVAYWRSVAARALVSSMDGPVHLNVPLREPLVPDGDDDWPEPLTGRPGGEPWLAAQRPLATSSRLDDVPERGAVLVGAGAVDPAAAAGLAEAAGWPLLAEPTSGARSGPVALGGYPLLLADAAFAADHRPELVVTVGKPGLSRSVLRWLGSAARQVIVDPHRAYADPTRTAARLLPAVPVVERRPDGPWLAAWRRADEVARTAVGAVLEEDGGLSEPRLARDLLALLPAGALLFVGNSRPVRDLEAYAAARDGVRILGNRGVSGIDGSTSAAVGAALANRGPAYGLIGDLAVVHDLPGLVLGPDEPRPDLCLVVVNNDGGGIFSILEPAGQPGFERVFGTPHRLDLARLAAAVGLPYRRVEQAADLPAALSGQGLRLVEVPADRTASAALHRRLQNAVSAALAR